MAAHSCCRAMPDLENESSPPSSFESMSDSLSEGSNKSEGMPVIENRATVKEKEEFRAQRYDGYAPISKILKDMPDSDEERPRLDGLLWEVQEMPPWNVLGAFVASLPLSIIAGWSLILHGYVASVGTSFLQFCNPNSHRNRGGSMSKAAWAAA